MSYIKYFNTSGKLPIGTVTDGINITTSLVLLSSIYIPPNTFTTGDYLSLEGMYSKYGVTNTSNLRFYYNTGDTLTGAIQIGNTQLTATEGYFLFNRKLFIADASGGGSGNSIGTQVIFSTTNYESDHQAGTRSNLPINWTSDVYILCTGDVSNPSDTIESYGFKIYTY
jgi:hypothetical protein